MLAIASLEDLRAAQKDLLEAKDLNELKAVFKINQKESGTKKNVGSKTIYQLNQKGQDAFFL